MAEGRRLPRTGLIVVAKNDVTSLGEFIGTHGPVALLGGAGISTASGIPDYRDADGKWKNAQPVQFGDFVNRGSTRQRYWARSYAGWSRIVSAAPNKAHHALATLERQGRIDTLITQNVDGLHRRAGSERVIDLHGRLDRVVCLDCRKPMERATWQHRLADANPGWHASVDYYKPDGDASLSQADVEGFNVPACPSCNGMVKPDVVFFGENVPKPRVEEAMQAVERAPALLVVGSSLMVFSGYRFARKASELGKPICILNRGLTRADDLATLKIDRDCGRALSELVGE